MRTEQSYTSDAQASISQDDNVYKLSNSCKHLGRATALSLALACSSIALLSSAPASAEAKVADKVGTTIAVDQAKNDQKPEVIDHEFNATAASDDAILAANDTAAVEGATEVTSSDTAAASGDATASAASAAAPGASADAANVPAAPAPDKAAAMEKFNAFAADRPKRSGSLAEGGLNTTSGIVQWLLSTIAVLGLIFLMAFLIKKSRFVQRAGGTIRLETQMAIGPKERVVQIRVGDRHLLLGVTPSNINLILELDNDAEKKKKADAKAAAESANADDSAEEELSTKERVEALERIAAELIAKEDYAVASPSRAVSFEEGKADAPVERARPGFLEPDDLAKAKIKAQAARRVAARAAGTVNTMPDDDVLYERASRLKKAMRDIGVDETTEAQIPSAARTAVEFSEGHKVDPKTTDTGSQVSSASAATAAVASAAVGAAASEAAVAAVANAVGDASEHADAEKFAASFDSSAKEEQSPELANAVSATTAAVAELSAAAEAAAAAEAQREITSVSAGRSSSRLDDSLEADACEAAAKGSTAPRADGRTGLSWEAGEKDEADSSHPIVDAAAQAPSNQVTAQGETAPKADGRTGLSWEAGEKDEADSSHPIVDAASAAPSNQVTAPGESVPKADGRTGLSWEASDKDESDSSHPIVDAASEHPTGHVASSGESVPKADGTTGVSWETKDDAAKDSEADDASAAAPSQSDSTMADAQSASATSHSVDADAQAASADDAEQKGEEFAAIFAKAYDEAKERFDEFSATDAGRDIMAADPNVGYDSSDESDAKETAVNADSSDKKD